ncbi:canalicular multispecific organic anion transporter 1 [Dichotomopilus funicola]|uniref:Canalicular multispecific organic anion transporter 1 n=1 Tax=Dichotomopilus funicola TaxID=1934379 RepID=A0AAN6ZLN3_9PEZI|nr:canalicular multispecific organic anion transporter 1 [Dichotomopilus funicola]
MACLNDDAFGPAVRGCRGDFDFTLHFEQVFFTLLPASLFVVVSLARMVHLWRKRVMVGGVWLRCGKMIAISTYAALQLVLLVLATTSPSEWFTLSTAASSLALVAALLTLPLSYLEHARAPRPSMLLHAYLTVTLLLDIAQARTVWLAGFSPTEMAYARAFTAAVVVKAVILLLEGQSKTRWIRWIDQPGTYHHSPEETSGLYGLGAYLWLNGLLGRGYRRVLGMDDLFPLDANLRAEALYARLGHHFENVEAFRGKRHGLARVLARALAVPLLVLPVGPRIAYGAFQFCQPFLIQTLLRYLQGGGEGQDGEMDRNIGYGLIGATALVYLGIAASSALYWYFQERALYMSRGLLATAVFRKTVTSRLRGSSDSAALTLMSADIERIIVGGMNLHELWSNSIQVGLACWLLQRQIGAAFVAPLIVVVVSTAGLTMLARYTGPRQKVWMARIQERVGHTAGVIAQIRHLKMAGLAETVEKAVAAAVVGYTPLLMGPVFAFAFASRTLDVTTIFTALSFITLLAAPLSLLFQTIPVLVSAFTCLERIQAYLEAEARVDCRVFEPTEKEKDSEDEKSAEKKQKQDRVRITNATFAWDPTKPTLHDISLTIPAGQLTLVIGPVASGKSTLCKALLGELPLLSGQITLYSPPDRPIGYAPQTPTLSNTTIRSTILGPSALLPYNDARYNAVLDATLLRPDLALLPAGDETNIGSHGIALSGGQKARVAMARALYLDADFCVFDDVLSGLDADTAEGVFMNVFGGRDERDGKGEAKGLLRQRGATAVLCTHAVRFLPWADWVVVLGADGRVVEEGKFEELKGREGGYVAGLGVETPGVGTPKTPPEPTPTTSSPTDTASPEITARMTGDWAVYRHYFTRIPLSIRLVFLLFGITWGGFANLGTLWLTLWSADVASSSPTHTNAYYTGLYALFQILTLASLAIQAYVCFTHMITFSGARIHAEALRTVLRAPLAFFSKTDTGVVVNLFSQDLTLVDGQLPQAVCNVVLTVFEVLGMAAVIATASPYVAVTYPVLGVVLWVLQRFYLRTSRQMRLLDLEAKSPLYTHFIDTLHSLATVRAHNWTHPSLTLNKSLLDTSQRPAYLLAMIQRWLAFTLQLVVAVLAIAVVALATQIHVNTAGGNAAGFTGASLVTLMSFGESLTTIIRFYTLLETSIGAVSRLKAFSETVAPEDQEGETGVPGVEWPRGKIEIKGVSASYGGHKYGGASGNESGSEEDGEKQLVLRDLNLTIAPGEKVAICGRSGSGKSSLLLLLLHLLDPLPSSPSNPNPNPNPENPNLNTSTTITTARPKDEDENTPTFNIDSLPLSSLSRSALRHSLFALPQDPVFLPPGTSVRDNLDPDSEATAAECRGALEAVSLWVYFAGLLSQGEEDEDVLKTRLTPDEMLSQGQKQLFSLARMVVRRRVRARRRAAEFGGNTTTTTNEKEKGPVPTDTGILLLDEVSSSVDQDTDEQMQAVIRAEFRNYTIVMVSHRLGMVMASFDRVVVMEGGRIVEVGGPRELVEREGGRFRELWMVGQSS